MKRYFYLTVLPLSFFINSVSFAQGSGEATGEGTTIIDAYYAAPNLLTSFAKAVYINSGATGVSISGIGPVGGRIEHLMSEKVGLGVDFNYSNSKLAWRDVGNNSSTIYDYRIEFPRFRIMGTFNLHFGRSEHFDAYWAIRAGYQNFQTKFTTTDPSFTGDSSVQGLSPIAFRTAVGGRYFFTENIGLNFEVGFFGGGLVAAGLSAKF